MANAQTLEKEPAPLKVKAKSKEEEYVARVKDPANTFYDPYKSYVYQLSARNPEREKPIIDARSNKEARHQEYKPFQNIVFTSQIIWNGQRRMLRYYDGCTTPFVDEQPIDKDTIELLIKQTQPRSFNNGKFSETGDNKWLLFYMDVCSWNTNSPFRTKTASQVFFNTSADAKALARASRIDQMEEAMKLAREASESKMKIHSGYLGLATTDYDSGNELSEKEMRTQYRDAAIENPGKFIESFGNKSIEIRYFINKAMADGTIDSKFNPNKATWGTAHTEICDISGLYSTDAISERLFDFSQSEKGEEFLVQLKALYSN